MDEMSKDIIKLIQSGNYCSPDITKISRRLRKSPATIMRRIRELEGKGVIKEYTARVNPDKVGKTLTSFLRIQLEYSSSEKKLTHEEFMSKYVEYFKKLPEVQEIFIPLGTWDFMIKVKTRDIHDQYNFISERIMPLGTIHRMESLVMMKNHQERSYIEPE